MDDDISDERHYASKFGAVIIGHGSFLSTSQSLANIKLLPGIYREIHEIYNNKYLITLKKKRKRKDIQPEQNRLNINVYATNFIEKVTKSHFIRSCPQEYLCINRVDPELGPSDLALKYAFFKGINMNIDVEILKKCLRLFEIFFIANHKYLKITILLFFILSFTTIFLGKKNQIIFEKSQKFYAIFYEKNLYFSKQLKPTKQVKSWLKHFEVKNSELIKKCPKNKNLNKQVCQKCFKNYCELYFENQQILVLKGRNNLSKICRKYKAKKFDAVVNVTKKYQIPQCFAKYNNPKIIIDNSDFLLKGTNFLEIKNKKLIYFYNN